MARFALRHGRNRGVDRDIFDNEARRFNSDLSYNEVLDIFAGDNEGDGTAFIMADEKRDKLFFPLPAYLEHLLARYIISEISEPTKTLLNEEAFMRRFKLNSEVTNNVRERLKLFDTQKRRETAEALKLMITATQDAKPESHFYVGGNSMSLLCGLRSARDYRESFEWFRNSEGRLKRLNLMGVDFSHVDLNGCDFSYSCLDDADLSYTMLTKTTFKQTMLNMVKHREYGLMLNSAIMSGKPLRAVAGMESGGLLVYSLDSNSKRILPIHSSSVNAVCSIGEIVFSADEDGIVERSIIADKSENDKTLSLYGAIKSLSIISITDKNDPRIETTYVYVGTVHQGIYRFDNAIAHYDTISNPVSKSNSYIKHLRAFEFEEEIYLVVVLSNSKIFIVKDEKNAPTFESFDIDSNSIIPIESNLGADITGVCVTESEIVYSTDEALYYMPLVSVFSGHHDIYRKEFDGCIGIDVAYAKNSKRIYALCKEASGYKVTIYDSSWHPAEVSFPSSVADMKDGKIINAFAVSDDEEYMSFAGSELTVVRRNRDSGEYEIENSPIVSKMSCEGMLLENCEGLSEKSEKFFEDRRAKIIKSNNSL
jgi:hypothetical protein